MLKLFARMACALSLAAMAFATPAAAGVITISLKGTISEGFDTIGVFGTPGMDLAGQQITLTSVYDLDRGRVDYGYVLRGGSDFGETSPGATLLQVSDGYFFISGSTRVEYYAQHQYVIAGDHYTGGAYQNAVQGDTSPGSTFRSVQFLITSVDAADFAGGLKDNYSGPACPGTNICSGIFRYGVYGPGLNFNPYVTGEFTPDTLSVSYSPQPVPEPGTWALMIMGFGLAGAAIRRQRKPAFQS